MGTAAAAICGIKRSQGGFDAEVLSSYGRWIALIAMLWADSRFIRYEIPEKSALRFGAGIIGALIVIAATLLTNKLGLGAAASFAIWCAAYCASLILIPALVMRRTGKADRRI